MKFKRFENNALVTYEFDNIDEAKVIFNQWRCQFILDNHVQDINTDKSYQNFWNELEDILRRFPVEQNLEIDHCKICDSKDHEGVFCRCENRNIRIAKLRRDQGLSNWDMQKDNKAEDESHRERLSEKTS